MTFQDVLDKTYLRYISDEMNNSHNIRVQLWGYFTTLNLAFYAAIYSTSRCGLWQLTGIKLFLLILLIIINLCIFHVYKRAELLARNDFYDIRDLAKTGSSESIKKLLEGREERHKADPDAGGVKSTITFLLKLFSAIPLAFIILLVFNAKQLGVFVWLAFLVSTGIIYFFVPLLDAIFSRMVKLASRWAPKQH